MGGKVRLFSKAFTNTAEVVLPDPVRVWVDVCGVVNERHLLIQGWAFHPGHAEVDFELTLAEESESSRKPKATALPHTVLRTTRLDVNKHFELEGEGSQWGFSLLTDWPHDQLPSPEQLALNVVAGQERCVVELKPFSTLSGEELFGHCTTWRGEEKLRLKRALHRHMGNKVFEIPGLRKLSEEQLKQKVNWHWENLLSVPGKGLFLAGWLLDGQQELSALVIRTADGTYSRNLLEDSVCYPRPDVLEAFSGSVDASYQPGLYVWADMPHLMERAQLELVFVTREGAVCELPIQQKVVGHDITLASQQVLVNFQIGGRDYENNMQQHVGPALAALWQHRNASLGELEVEQLQFGPKVESPKRSVIVPLYGRYDFLLHQVAQFTNDSDFAETELIYVLDDPRLYNEFIPFCHDTSKLFPVSFRVIYGGRNLGYAGANNLGARFAQANKLVLLNSDVIPSAPGWLSRIEEKVEGLDDVGVVAPKLVFDDGTIQHVGISFAKDPRFGDLWLNEHPGKGNPEWLLKQEAVTESPAVTGACMFIDKALYDLVGGLDETYVLGDFEDTDLCLKLRKAGYRHYVLGDEKLYHLERQSQDLFDNRDWKFKITLYNAWQHTERWGDLIEELVA
ncbi:glycosyltransferase family 2 protein [Microbulbifer agarilyticus]|uniref:glycosyltransferase n=1 Tax=Microbulbifer agarilyticus TaxID=260552 RepID=UPI001C9710ED|nr:glycosyltransferase family 2 protein [Microbulbifer agarilyticus]MBY6190508.1 glycosyltransferase family 2 protein [Microbulbifer agarilyticus]